MVNSEIYYNQLQKKYSRRITLGLSRIKKALKLLGNPEKKLKRPINIIGSDGKLAASNRSSISLKRMDNLHQHSFLLTCLIYDLEYG